MQKASHLGVDMNGCNAVQGDAMRCGAVRLSNLNELDETEELIDNSLLITNINDLCQ
jgi:hypothetical protein